MDDNAGIDGFLHGFSLLNGSYNVEGRMGYGQIRFCVSEHRLALPNDEHNESWLYELFAILCSHQCTEHLPATSIRHAFRLKH